MKEYSNSIIELVFGHSGAITPIVISPDNKSVLTTSKDHRAIVSAILTGEKIAVLGGCEEEVGCYG